MMKMFGYSISFSRKLTQELIKINQALLIENKENEKRAAELVVANKELAFQNKEKEKRASELILANKELAFQNKEKAKRAAELLLANNELKFQNKEKERHALELTFANVELEKAEKSQKEYILALKEMMYMTSHQLRQPVVQILGLSNVITPSTTYQELVEFTGLMKQAAESLDEFTKEFTNFIHIEELKQKEEKISLHKQYRN